MQRSRRCLLGSALAIHWRYKNQRLCAPGRRLGNDETHYSRKWVDMDINDLKILIRLTVTWMKAASCQAVQGRHAGSIGFNCDLREKSASIS